MTFNYPVQGDTNWGPVLTAWSTAVTNALSIISGGNASFLTITSQSSNPATTGFLRLANTDAIDWRNFANTGNLALAVNASNQLTFNGIPIGATTSLTNSHIFVGNVSNQPADVAMSGDATITNTGVVSISGPLTLTGLTISPGQILVPNGSAAAPSYSFSASTNTGIYQIGNTLVVSANGTIAAQFVNNVLNLSVPLDTGSNKITSLAPGTVGTDAVNLNQLNTKLDLSGGTMSGAINMGSNKITSVTQGSNTGEAISFPVGTSQISLLAVTESAQDSQSSGNTGTVVDNTAVAAVTNGWVMAVGHVDLSITANGSGIAEATINVDFNGFSIPGGKSTMKTVGTAGGAVILSIPIGCTSLISSGAAVGVTSRYIITTGTFVSIVNSSLAVVSLKR